MVVVVGRIIFRQSSGCTVDVLRATAFAALSLGENSAPARQSVVGGAEVSPMNNNEFSNDFIERLATLSRVPVSAIGVGRLVTTCTVLGGGGDSIVLGVGTMIVRLVKHRDGWIAEHLVVRLDGT